VASTDHSSDLVTIRDALATERAVLEALQRRSSEVWQEYREQLAANPEAIALSQTFVKNGWVRVAVPLGAVVSRGTRRRC
jgi:hypothetical protein